MQTKIDRVLIVGYGSIGKRHYELAKHLLPFSEIKILRQKKFATFGNHKGKFLKNLSEVSAFNPNIAVIATPASNHIKTAMYLAKYGVHLLIEKPISNRINGVSELIKLANQKNLILGVGYNLRHSQSLNFFKNFIIQKKIGNVLSVRCEVGQYLPEWRGRADYRERVSGNKKLGGGLVLELSHEIDYLRWIFGDVSWVRATILKQSDLDVSTEDYAHLVLGFANHKTQNKFTASVIMDYFRRDHTRTCTVIGTKGTIIWDGIRGQVKTYSTTSKKFKVEFENKFDRNKTFELEWIDFMESVTNCNNPKATAIDGLRVLEIIEAAFKSTKNGIQTKVTKTALPHKLNL